LRVLVVNKFWYQRGGLERVMFDEVSWLESAGHLIAHFSTKHPLNEPSAWSDYFTPYLELGEGGNLSAAQKLRAVGWMLYNREAVSRFTRLLIDFRPDVVHVHGIHRQLSSSLLVAASQRRIPVIQTMHDYHAFCCADVLLRGNGALCEPALCSLSRPWASIRHRCVRGSLALSGLASGESFCRNVLLRSTRLMARLVSPSRFLAGQLQRAGLHTPPVDVIPNAVPLQPVSNPGSGLLFTGRLAPEKGLAVLLEAAHQTGIPLVIAGDGPLMSQVRSQSSAGVSLLGRVPPQRVSELLAASAAVVVPSIWYENAPLSVLEAMACGTPVVASDIGGIPEIVRSGVDGLLVPPGSADALAAAIRTLIADPDKADEMGSAARDRVAKEFSPVRHVESLVRTYELALGSAP
jgi:glycosyltransferase involved in cell wall biosynthesis